MKITFRRFGLSRAEEFEVARHETVMAAHEATRRAIEQHGETVEWARASLQDLADERDYFKGEYENAQRIIRDLNMQLAAALK